MLAAFHWVNEPPDEGSVSICAALLLATYRVELVRSVGLKVRLCGWLRLEFSTNCVALLSEICAALPSPERNR